MRAAVLHVIGQPVQIEDLAVDDLQASEVLVETAVAGLCHTDLHYIHGDWPAKLPIVLGHEAAGVVAATGPAVTRVKPGDHVVVFNAPSCGRCKQCLRGRPTLCPHPVHSRPQDARPRLRLDGRPVEVHSGLGAFAEQMIVNEAGVTPIRPDIPFEAAALLSCAVMAGFGGTAFTAKVGVGESVAVIGAGGVGLNAVQAARHVGAFPIVAVDKSPENLELATRLGATHTVDAAEQEPVAAVRELTGGVDHAIEAIGLKVTTEQAWRMLDAGGCVTVLGMLPVSTRIEIPPADLLSEKRIQGSHMGSLHWELQVPLLLDLYLAGRLELDSLVTRRLRLDEINDGYADLDGKPSGRQVIAF